MILKVGLTGGLASGKSTVAGRLRANGIPVLDADLIVHDLYREGGAGARAVAEAFGPEFLAVDGSVDRPKLSAHVFHDPPSLARLNALIHPLVHAAQAKWFGDLEAKGEALGVVEATLLVETGGRERFDVLVTVSAPADVRLARAVVIGLYRGEFRRSPIECRWFFRLYLRLKRKSYYSDAVRPIRWYPRYCRSICGAT